MAFANNQQRSRLGRGLISLIGEPHVQSGRLPVEGEHRVVALELIRSSSSNPRQHFNEQELDELAVSIRERGLVQPLVVRPVSQEPGTFEIVAGERRWRASQRAGLKSVPVIIRDLTDKEVLELAIIENVQRTDLNAIEEARGYRELIERYGYQQDELSQIIGKSRSHLSNTMRLLKLPDLVQSMVVGGELTPGHARALIGREDAESLARAVVAKGMTVREIEELVQQPIGGVEPRKRTREKDADTRAFEGELTEAIGLRVEVKRGASGEGGVVSIRYANFDQLDWLRSLLLKLPVTAGEQGS